MIPHIPAQRQFKVSAAKPFDDLVAYIEAGQDQSLAPRRQLGGDFANVIDYATTPTDEKSGAEKCIAIRTHGVTGIATASLEMNTVAQKNTRCQDPVYHIILSWPEHEQPAAELIFDAAEHALEALGLGAHQYVLAVHGNTDNMHCHISVNRIHPRTFKSRNIAWAHKNLHRAARESEIKHGWSNDNGLFVVEVDAHGKKHVVPSRDPLEALTTTAPGVHLELGREEILPTWHDPDSLDSWLKTKVAKALKPALAELSGWAALHAWLSDYDITLNDSGGGGMQLRVISPDTGEILDIAASKGLRVLKRIALEKRWGPFSNSHEVACLVPDLSHLTPQQIAKGVTHFLANSFDGGIPPAQVRLARQGGNPNQETMQALARDAVTQTERVNERTRQPGEAQRAERKAQRAAARLDLRQRFAQHRSDVSRGDTAHFTRAKALRSELSLYLTHIRVQRKAAKRAIPKAISPSVRLISHIEIDAESLRRKLEVEADFQKKSAALRVSRTPPLSWRAWLYEQSSLGDQGALSALRGIVYQAQRDAKPDTTEDDPALEDEILSAQAPEQQFRKVMARLLAQEKKETAIRAAHSSLMRPYQVDAMLAQYAGMQWRVTGNGNVEYRDQDGGHLFTDRGNRLTFDRKRVSDDEIRLALAHAQQKFGLPLTLTGEDPVFTERMARLADDMGISILNPELRLVMENHRFDRQAPRQVLVGVAPDQLVAEAQPELIAPLPAVLQASQVPQRTPALTDPSRRRQRDDEMVAASRSDQAVAAVVPTSKPEEPTPTMNLGGVSEAADLLAPASSNAAPALQALLPLTPTTSERESAPAETPHERLRAMVLAIDPNAKFVTASSDDREKTYFGKVVASLGETEPGVAQFSTRLDAYLLHPSLSAPAHEPDDVIEVQYKNGQATAKNSRGQGKGGRGD